MIQIYARDLHLYSIKKPFWIILVFAILCIALLVTAAYSLILGDRYVPASEEHHMMINCANPEGIVVEETGRVIAQGETFEVIGYEIIYR